MSSTETALVLLYEDAFLCVALKPADSVRGKVAGVAGLEPVTSAVTGQRSNQLSYAPARETDTRETTR